MCKERLFCGKRHDFFDRLSDNWFLEIITRLCHSKTVYLKSTLKLNKHEKNNNTISLIYFGLGLNPSETGGAGVYFVRAFSIRNEF